VPQQFAWVVERFGKFHSVLDPGLNFLVPGMHRIRYVYSLKEEALSVPSQTAITRDNVNISIDGVLYIKITDAYKAAYGVDDPHYAITQLAQTTMRSEIGKLTLDKTFEERDNLNAGIVQTINEAAGDWGIACLRYEIRDITPPASVRTAMEMQAEAERRKRALVLDSEGERDAEINVAEGRKLAAILASEASMQERINQGKGEAIAIAAKAEATASAIQAVATAICRSGGTEASAYRVAEQYVAAFGQLAKESNTLVVPANSSDVGSMVAQAMSIYTGLSGAAAPKQKTAVSTYSGSDFSEEKLAQAGAREAANSMDRQREAHSGATTPHSAKQTASSSNDSRD